MTWNQDKKIFLKKNSKIQDMEKMKKEKGPKDNLESKIDMVVCSCYMAM